MEGGEDRRMTIAAASEPLPAQENSVQIEQEQQQQQPPMNDAVNEIDDGEGEDHDDQSGDGNDGDEEQRPKLPDDFYVVEAVRRKRTRKGKAQYLIKWRGWPEATNTWEPMENLTTIPDVIEAFEESLREGKQGSNRRSKHKQKKQSEQSSPPASYAIPTVKLTIIEEALSVPSVPSNEVDAHLNGLTVASSNKQDSLSEFAIHLQEGRPTEQVSPVEVRPADGTESIRVGPLVGARRRKSYAVKRFTKEPNSALGNTTGDGVVVGEDAVNNMDWLDSNNIVDAIPSISAITKIIKPVNYSTSTVNDTEEVSVNFLVRRSDGEEVVVDNKYLKENNPLLLINFYEQHLFGTTAPLTEHLSRG